MNTRWKIALTLVMLALAHRGSALVVVTNYPGTPTTNWNNSGAAQVILSEGGGIGVQPLVFNAGTLPVFPGDIVFLHDPNGGENPTNWEAVLRLFNPGDPTGNNGLPATECQTFFPTNVSSSTFTSFQLFPHVEYTTIGRTNADGSLTTEYIEYGPDAGLTNGQEAFINYIASIQTATNVVTSSNPPVVSIIFPTPGEVLTNQPFGAFGTFVISNGQAALASIWVQVDNSGWLQPGSIAPSNSAVWYSYEYELTPGSNTVQAYATDIAGHVSATNTVTFDYVVTAGAQFAGPPGTPVSGFGNTGGTIIITSVGGGIGVQPITNNASQYGPNATALAGDVVFLRSTNNGINPTNWEAVLHFVNPADPTGTNGLAATEVETFFQTNASSSYFNGFSLLPNVDYVAIFATNADGSISADADVFGPVGAILAGQEAILIYTASVQPAGSADLSLMATESPNPELEGYYITNTFVVSNAGPATATDVTVSNQLFLPPSSFIFVSATGGSTPTNGILLMNLGSLAPGATTTAQLIYYANQYMDNTLYTNTFEVLADQPDPDLTNNFSTVSFLVSGSDPFYFTSSTAECNSNIMTTVSQQVTNYSTELIAKLTNGTVVYDQKFTVPYSDPAVQAAITAAAMDLTNAGAAAYSGPAQTGYSQTTNTSSVTGPINITTNLIQGYKAWVGPATYPLGNFGTVTSFTLENIAGVSTNYPVCTGGTPSSFTLLAGQTDYDNFFLVVLNTNLTTTITSTYTNLAVYTMTQVNSAAQADVSLSANTGAGAVTLGSAEAYYLTVSNAGPNTASGVVISNRLPANETFVSVTGGATPVNGVLLVNLGPLAAGAATNITLVVNPGLPAGAANGQLTNQFQVFASTPDPVPANNSATVVSSLYDPIPGTPITGSVSLYDRGSIVVLNGTVFGSGPLYEINPNTNTNLSFITYTATPGDFILLNDPAGGSNPTNWVAVVRFFNPADLTGTNGLAATYSQAFFATNFGGAGFAGLKLFPNTNYVAVGPLATPTNFPTYVSFFVTQFGQAGAILAGQEAETIWIVNTPYTDLSLSASATPEPVGVGSNLVYTLNVSNALNALSGGQTVTATGVVVSNRIPANCAFVSATGGATPSGGVLLMNLGSLAEGTNTTVQVVVQPTNGVVSTITNTFQVFANEFDPNVTNNSATVVSTVTNVLGTGTTAYTTSVVEFDTFQTTNLNQRATNYSTELIAKLPNGTVVYDQTFPATYADPTVQTGITTAAGDLSGDGSSSYTGPTRTSLSQNLANVAAVTITNSINTNTTVVTTDHIGPVTIETGEFGVYERFTSNGAYTGPAGGNPQPFVIAAGGQDFDTFVTNKLTYFRTMTTTSNYLNSSVYVMTGVVAQVDVALSLQAAPNPVTVGAPLTYSLTVTNKSSTTATGVTVSNTLPGNVSLISVLPSQGSTSTNGGEVTYAVGSLPNGSSATLAIVVVPGAAGLLTNIAEATSTQTDSQPANNDVTNVTTAVSEAITNLVLTVLSAITLNPQTGLYEQQIQVSNGGPATPSSVLVFIHGLAANAKLYNATGTSNGVPYVQSTSPLGVGSNVVFLLEYYVPTRVAPANLTLTVVAGPAVTPPVVNGTILNISQSIVLGDGSVLVEFSAVAGQLYAVQYSSDMMTWRTAVPALTAPANQVQWIDAGPPKTDSPPASQPQRFYRVVHLNGQ